MDSLVQYLSPKNEDGSIDKRYSETTKRLMEMLGPKALNAIDALKNGQYALARQHGWVGPKICDHVYELAEEIDQKENHPHRWKSKRLKAQLKDILEEIGFTATQVSYLVKAKQFKEKLKFNAYEGRTVKVTLVTQLEFIESHGPRAQYIFSLMDQQGIRKAQKESKQKGELLTVKELEFIKSLHPIKPKQIKPEPSIDFTVLEDPITLVAEEVEETETELIEELCVLLEKIVTNTEFILKGYNRPEELVQKLQEPQIECVLRALANIAIPKPKYTFTTHPKNK